MRLERVYCSGGSPHCLFCTLVKFNRKTVTLMTNNGRLWIISPHLLSPIYDAKHTQLFVYTDEKNPSIAPVQET